MSIRWWCHACLLLACGTDASGTGGNGYGSQRADGVPFAAEQTGDARDEKAPPSGGVTEGGAEENEWTEDAGGDDSAAVCAEGELESKLGWIEVDYECGLGFEAPSDQPCDDEHVEADVCLPDACVAGSGGCDWRVLAIEAAGLALDTPSRETFCFRSREEACACLRCCNGTEVIRDFDSTSQLVQCEYIVR